MPGAAGTILIGYDGSDDAAQAIRCAAALLSPRRALVVHVWDSLAALLLNTDVDRLTGPIEDAATELDAEDREAAGRIAAEGAEIAREAGFESSAIAASGRPKAWPALLALADEHEVAAIVVGSRGLGGVKSALFGSVSAGVLHHSHRPLLIVPPLEELTPPGPVIFGYDGSEDARRAIAAAGRLLAVREARVETVWLSCTEVSPAARAGLPLSVVLEGARRIDAGFEEGASRLAKEGARLAAAAGLEARGESIRADGSLWYTLLDVARDHRAAAVVVGSRGRSSFEAALLGSVSRALAHHAPLPLLVVPPGR